MTRSGIRADGTAVSKDILPILLTRSVLLWTALAFLLRLTERIWPAVRIDANVVSIAAVRLIDDRKLCTSGFHQASENHLVLSRLTFLRNCRLNSSSRIRAKGEIFHRRHPLKENTRYSSRNVL
jgi:hypothetical protein